MNRIWNVLIADDEQKVCELIQYLVPWEELGLKVKAVVSNGIEAIEVIKREQIDIVITDARMPECDGIELIKWCHQHGENKKFIVISGYRHFEYAHGALQYGVDAYLLKPIHQKEFVEAIQKIIAALNAESAGREKLMYMEQQHFQDRDKMRRHFISSYIFDGRKMLNREIASMEEVNDEYRMQFQEGIFQSVFMKIDTTGENKYNIEKLLTKMQEISEEILGDFGSEKVGILQHSGVLMLVNYHISQEMEFGKKIEELYSKLENMLDIFEGLKLTIGISAKVWDISNLHLCMLQSADAVRYRIYLQNQEIIFYDKYTYDKVDTEQFLTKERRELLLTLLKAKNEDSIQKWLFGIKMEMKQNRNLSPVSLYYFAMELAEFLADSNEELQKSEKLNQLMNVYTEQMENAYTENFLWENVEKFLAQYIELLDKEELMEQTKPIRLIKEYIEAHYAENISLEIVAEQVNLSKNYVSAIFRKETGVNFSDYLTAQRMDHAVELLRKTDLSLAEIAERVGYADVKYFSKTCKKILGMKPTEYRKLYS